MFRASLPLSLLLFASLGRAETPVEARTPAPPPPPRAPADVDVRPVPGTLRTGKAAIVDVVLPASWPAATTMAARLGDVQAIGAPWSTDGHVWRMWSPIDVDAAPGDRALVVHVVLQDGAPVVVERTLVVDEAPYESRELTVSTRYTEPSRAQRRRARIEAREMDRALSKRTTERLWRGSFTRPVAGVETSPFGTARTYNGKKKSRHMGLDLDGKVGDAIAAAQRGRVVLATQRFYSGGTVVIDHGQGLFTMYFHMSRIGVKKGQLVEKGAPLGAVGATGQVTGPHLHFSVKLLGTYVDPHDVLAWDLADDPADRK